MRGDKDESFIATCETSRCSRTVCSCKRGSYGADSDTSCSLLQAIRPGVHGAKDGSYRATFEDKPLLSDIVFLRAWVAVDLPRFYNPVTNLLAPAPISQRVPKPSKVLPHPSISQEGCLLSLVLF